VHSKLIGSDRDGMNMLLKISSTHLEFAPPIDLNSEYPIKNIEKNACSRIALSKG
jgi:hypothetical protein